MLTEVVAVVGGEHHIGVVELAARTQGLEQRRDLAADTRQRREPSLVQRVDVGDITRSQARQRADVARHTAHVGLVERGGSRCERAREASLVARRGWCGIMGREQRHVREERHSRLSCIHDELTGVAHRDTVEVVGRRVTVSTEHAVFVEHIVVLRVRVSRDRARPGRPSRRYVCVAGAAGIPVQVFPEESGAVARGLQADGDRSLLDPTGARDLESAVHGPIREHSRVVRVLPGQHRHA